MKCLNCKKKITPSCSFCSEKCLEKYFDSPKGRQSLKKKKVHKSHARLRQTVCNIKYDNIINLTYFLNNNLAGHWRKVTCGKCIEKRKEYEWNINNWSWRIKEGTT